MLAENKNMKYKLCETNTVLCNSHIIPEFFYLAMYIKYVSGIYKKITYNNNALLLVILPIFIAFFSGVIYLYCLEMKIMKKLKIIAPDTWHEFLWWFGARAHPFKFRKFIKENQISEPELNELINSYKKTKRFVLICWGVLSIIVIGLIIFMLIMNL